MPPIPIPDNDQSLYLHPVSEFEVEEFIDSLAQTSSGDDCLGNTIIKLSTHVTVHFMTHSINCSFTHRSRKQRYFLCTKMAVS